MGKRSPLVVTIVTAGALRAPGLAGWLQTVAPAGARGEVTVAVVSDARVRALNRRYRRKDRVTDVLSFPAGEPGNLGDIVIAEGLAGRQARQAGHSRAVELRVLALHGLLHLLGYDHEHDDGRMARMERRLRRKGGLVEGLIERGLVDRIRTVGTTGHQAPTALSRPRQPRGPRRASRAGVEAERPIVIRDSRTTSSSE